MTPKGDAAPISNVQVVVLNELGGKFDWFTLGDLGRCCEITQCGWGKDYDSDVTMLGLCDYVRIFPEATIANELV